MSCKCRPMSPRCRIHVAAVQCYIVSCQRRTRGGLLHSPAHENLTISVRSDRGMNPSPILPILLTCVRFGAVSCNRSSGAYSLLSRAALAWELLPKSQIWTVPQASQGSFLVHFVHFGQVRHCRPESGLSGLCGSPRFRFALSPAGRAHLRAFTNRYRSEIPPVQPASDSLNPAPRVLISARFRVSFRPTAHGGGSQ